jgi:hypothetical protein
MAEQDKNVQDNSDKWAAEYSKAAAPDQNTELREKQAGGTDIEKKGRETFAYKHPFISGLARGAVTLGGLIPESTERKDYIPGYGVYKGFEHPEAAAELGRGLVGAQRERFAKAEKAGNEAQRQGFTPRGAAGALDAALYAGEGVVPVIGPWVGGMADELERGVRREDPYEVGHAVGGALGGGMASGGGREGAVVDVGKTVGEKIAPAIPEVIRHPREVGGRMRWEAPRPAMEVNGVQLPEQIAPGKVKPGVHNIERGIGFAGGYLGSGLLDQAASGGAGGGAGHFAGGVAGGAILPPIMDKIFPEPPAWTEGRLGAEAAAEKTRLAAAQDELLQQRAGIPRAPEPVGPPTAPQVWNGPPIKLPGQPEPLFNELFGKEMTEAERLRPDEVPFGRRVTDERLRTTPKGKFEGSTAPGVRETPFELEPTAHAQGLEVPKDWLPSKRELGKPVLGEKEVAPPKKPGAAFKPGTEEAFPQGYNAELEEKPIAGLQSKIPTGRGSMPKEAKAEGPAPKAAGKPAPKPAPKTPAKINALNPNATGDLLQSLRDENARLRESLRGNVSDARRTEAETRIKQNQQFLEEHEQRGQAPRVPGATNFKVTNEMGIRWAHSPDGKFRVSIPKGVADADIDRYAAPKLEEQAQIHGAIPKAIPMVPAEPVGGPVVPGAAPGFEPTMTRSAAEEAKAGHNIGGTAEPNKTVMQIPEGRFPAGYKPDYYASLPRETVVKLAEGGDAGAAEFLNKALKQKMIIIPR